ncbi:aqualysin-1-like [Glandiceps talaboti]
MFVLLLMIPLMFHSVDSQEPIPAPVHRPSSAIEIENRYIVVFNEGKTEHDVIRVSAQAVKSASTNSHHLDIDKLFNNTFRGFTATMDDAILEEIRLYPEVSYIEQDVEVILLNSPAHLDRIDQREPLSNPPDVSYTPLGSAQDVDIYIVDSGIREDHEQFNGKIRFVPDESEKCDFMQGESPEEALEEYCESHGTNVAGVVGGKDYGVAPDATLWDVRVLVGRCTHDDVKNYLSDALHGLDMIVHHRYKGTGDRLPAVVVLPFGTPDRHYSQAFNDATTYMDNKGYVFVMAAGNSDCEHLISSLHSGLVAGSSISIPMLADDTVFDSNTGSCVDLFAPGYQVDTASSDTITSTQQTSGTSISAAIVAGTAAMIIAENPTIVNPQEIEDKVINRATPDVLQFLSLNNNAVNKLVYAGQ